MKLLICLILLTSGCKSAASCYPGHGCMGTRTSQCVIATRGIPPEFYHNTDCQCDKTCECWSLR